MSLRRRVVDDDGRHIVSADDTIGNDTDIGQQEVVVDIEMLYQRGQVIAGVGDGPELAFAKHIGNVLLRKGMVFVCLRTDYLFVTQPVFSSQAGSDFVFSMPDVNSITIVKRPLALSDAGLFTASGQRQTQKHKLEYKP